MGAFEQGVLSNNMNRLGELSTNEFLAIKATKKKLIHVQEIRQFLNANNQLINLNQVRPGETIQMVGTMRPMTTQAEQSGVARIDNVVSINFNEKTHALTIEGINACFTSNECLEEMILLKDILESPMFDMTIAELNNLIPPNASLTDWEIVKDKYRAKKRENEVKIAQEQQVTHDFSFDDF